MKVARFTGEKTSIMPMKIYLAGPMTNIPQFNFPAFDAAEADLTKRGYEVVPPADLHDPEVRAAALASKTGSMLDLPRHLTWGQFLAEDIRMIADDGIEGIVVMPGWKTSRGARLETYVGRLCGLPVFRYEEGVGLLPRISSLELSVVFGSVA